MVFDKPPCKNREVPLFLLRKIWDEFIMGFHANYYDINELHGVGLDFVKDQPNDKHNPLRGPPTPRHVPNPS